MAHWPPHLLTAEEFADLLQDDDWSEELVDGVPCRFPPGRAWHGITCSNVAGILFDYCKATGFGRAGLRSGLIVARNPDSVLGPDIQVFSARHPPDNPKGWPSVPPVLVAEVVDGPADYHHILSKVPLYLAFGVELVWIVRPQFQDVQIHRLADQQAPFDRWRWINRDAAYFTSLREDDSLDGGDVLPGFSCQVSDLFA